MEFEIGVNELKTEINILQGIAENKLGVATLATLLIETTEDGIKMVATDLDTTVQIVVEAKVKTQGAICIPAKKLCNIIKSLDAGKVKLKTEANNWVKVTSGTSKFRIAGLSKDQFPTMPTVTSSEVILDGEDLKSLIKHTNFAITQEESRYALSGAKVEVADGTVTMIATDGHRVSLMSVSIDDPEATLDVLIPKKALTEVSKFAGNEVVITDSPNNIKFESGNRILIARKIVGNFPDYTLILPVDNDVKVEVDADKFVKVLKRVSQAADEDSRAIKLDISSDKITLSANGQDGDSLDELECTTTELPDEGITIYLNWSYLVDFLSLCKTVTMNMKSGTDSVKLVEGNAVCITMPLRAG